MPRRRRQDHTAAILGTTAAVVGGAALLAALFVPRRASAYTSPEGLDLALELDGIKVYRSGSLLWWIGGDLSIDYDGAPNAYAPPGFGKPLDHLANAGRPGRWRGIYAGPDGTGTPVIQGPGDPFPGYYVSTTALGWPGYKEGQPGRYVDSTKVPYIALPPVFLKLGARKGDLALVESTKTAKRYFAIFADVGPEKKLGEGSIALARALGVESSALRKSGINVSLFVGSGDRQPHTDEEIQRRGAALVTRA